MGETPFGGAGFSVERAFRPVGEACAKHIGSKSRKAGTKKQKAPNSDIKESPAVS